MNFASDNTAPAAPAVMDALTRANAHSAPAYGTDPWSEAAAAEIARIFERDCAVFLVSTGTAANALALAAACPPWGAALCHRESHVENDECNAPEFFAGGAKLVALPGRHGKLAPDTVLEALDARPAGMVHAAQPAALSLTQASEAGTVYRPDEIAALAEAARTRGLHVHMDGARFANAVASLGCAPADITWRAGVDVLTLGATKGGAMAAEAVVVFTPALAETLAVRRKRAGHLVSKGRWLGAQMAGWLADDAWLTLARHANAMAARLAEGLAATGRRTAMPVEANEVFAVLRTDDVAALRAEGAVFYDWPSAAMAEEAGLRNDETIVRLVCSWATEADEVEALLRAIPRPS